MVLAGKARTSYSLPMFYTYLNVSVFTMVGIFLEVLVVEHVESAVRNENLRYANAFWSLIVLDNGGNDTRKSESRTVESVAKLGLSGLGVAITAMQTVCLIAFEVADRRYLEPTFLSGAPYLEVVADG